MVASVYNPKHQPSPIPKCGLEIALDVNFLIADIKWRYRARLIKITKEH